MKPYIILLLLLNMILAGCGQPGPLYLPGHAAPVYVPPEPAQKSEQPKPEPAK